MGNYLEFLARCFGSSIYSRLVGLNLLFSAQSTWWDLSYSPNIGALSPCKWLCGAEGRICGIGRIAYLHISPPFTDIVLFSFHYDIVHHLPIKQTKKIDPLNEHYLFLFLLLIFIVYCVKPTHTKTHQKMSKVLSTKPKH